MLKVKNLTKIYTSKKAAAVTALQGVSIDFGESGLVFLLGKSGSGKSTMLSLLGGLDTPTSGEIIVGNRSSSSFSSEDFDSYRNTEVGFVFQEYNLIDSYTVETNIGLALELQGKKPSAEEIDEMLRTVDLVERGETLYDRQISEISGGQKQRVAIARALIKNPKIILADEPTGALDSRTGIELYELLQKLAKDKLIIVVTHDRDNAEKFGDRIIELADGKVISDTNPTLNLAVKTDSAVTPATTTEFVKSRLPFRRSFVLGIGSLKSKPFRLVVSALLWVMIFMLTGFALVASSVNEQSAQLLNTYERGNHMATLTAVARDSSGEIYNNQYKTITAAQIATLKKFNGGSDPINVYGNMGANITEYLATYNLGGLGWTIFGQIFLRSSSKNMMLAELDPATGESDALITPDSRFINASRCRLPNKAGELAITDFYFELFMNHGYKEYADDVVISEYGHIESEDYDIINIKTPDDIIGKQLGYYTVVGVYSTEHNIADYNISYDYSDYADALINGTAKSILTYGFSYKDPAVGKRYDQTELLVKLSGDYDKDTAMLDDLTYKIAPNVYTSVYLTTASIGFVNEVSFLYHPTTITVLFALMAVFAVFAAILTMNFLSASIDFRRKEYGILRALGARKSDLYKICLSESLFLAVIQFIIAIIGLVVLCAILNGLYITIFHIGFWHILVLMLLAIGMSAISTILPMRKIAKKKPNDIINET